MKALTLHVSWAYAVAHLGKQIENRTRPPPSTLPLGSRFAIHAGLGETMAEWAAVTRAAGPDRILAGPVRTRCGAVVAVVTLAGWRDMRPERDDRYLPGWQARTERADQSPWWIGPVGWLLADVVTLPEPVPAKGALGMWTLPDDVAAEVVKQERAAKAAGEGR